MLGSGCARRQPGDADDRPAIDRRTPRTGHRNEDGIERATDDRAAEVAIEVLRRRAERQRFDERAAEDGWRNPHGLVFTTPIGTPIDPRNFGHAVETLTERVIGRKVNPHALRHTAATLLHEAGVSMKVAQAILGHTTSEMTSNIYTHVLDEQHDRAAAAIDDLLAREA